MEALHKTWSKSIERDDLHRLISRMDDVIDYIEAAAERVALYELTEMTADVRSLADVVLRSTEAVEVAIRGLRDIKNAERLVRMCIQINQLENEGDTLLRSAMARLFKETNPMLVIKWKEIYELLEIATDRCEDVANTVEGIVLEQA